MKSFRRGWSASWKIVVAIASFCLGKPVAGIIDKIGKATITDPKEVMVSEDVCLMRITFDVYKALNIALSIIGILIAYIVFLMSGISIYTWELIECIAIAALNSVTVSLPYIIYSVIASFSVSSFGKDQM